jgi:hypothetical protein
MSDSSPDDGFAERVLRDALESILCGPDLSSALENARRILVASDAVWTCPTVNVEWSTGQGEPGGLPAVWFLDVRARGSARRGLRCAFLFRGDASGVYLALIRGARVLGGGRDRGEARLRRAPELERLSERFSLLAEHGFRLDDGLDLHTSPALGDAYRRAAVAYRLYQAGRMPDDARLEEDLATLLHAYTDYVASETDLSRVAPASWLFRLDVSVRTGDAAWCPLREFGSWIHVGDIVYLWAGGNEPSLAAVAVAVREPDERADGARRVRVRVTRALEPPVPLSTFAGMPPLEGLARAASSRSTTAPIPPLQARALEALLEGMRSLGPRHFRSESRP